MGSNGLFQLTQKDAKRTVPNGLFGGDDKSHFLVTFVVFFILWSLWVDVEVWFCYDMYMEVC